MHMFIMYQYIVYTCMLVAHLCIHLPCYTQNSDSLLLMSTYDILYVNTCVYIICNVYICIYIYTQVSYILWIQNTLVTWNKLNTCNSRFVWKYLLTSHGLSSVFIGLGFCLKISSPKIYRFIIFPMRMVMAYNIPWLETHLGRISSTAGASPSRCTLDTAW
jgi:hypothetical protein